MKGTVLLPAILVLALSACSKQDDDHERTPTAKTDLERIRNTEHIGYSGNAVADKVQGAIDANAQRPETQSKLLDAETGEDDSSSSKDKDTE